MSKENDEFRALLSKLNALATKTERDVKQVLNQEYTAQPPDHRQRWLRSAAERLEARKNPMLLVVAEFIYDKCDDESIRGLLRARNTGLTKRLRETHGRDFVEEATNGLKRIWGEDANLGFPKAYVVDRITGDKLVAYRTLCREATNSRFGLDVLWGPQFGILARSISEVGDGMITTAAIKHARKTLEKMCQQESAPTSKVNVDRENGVTATAQQSHKRSHDKALPAQVQEVAWERERKKRRRYSSIGAASSHAQERVQERDSGMLHRAAPPNSAGHVTSEEEELSESDLSSQHGRWADTALSDFSASPQPSVNLILPGYDEDHSICRDDELGIFHHDDDEAPCLPASPLHSGRHLSVPISNQTTLKQQSPLFLSPIQEMPEPSSTAPDKMIVIPPYMVDDDMDNTFPIAPSNTNAENDELVKARERFTGSKWLSGDCIAHVVKQWRTADIRIIDPLALKIVNGHDVRSRLPKLRKENRSLFVPFHHNDSHWVLFYVRNLTDPVIEIYDSLNKYDPEMSSCIREFVRDVPDLFNAKIKFKDCPRQKNSHDCGVHCLENMRRLIFNLEIPVNYDGKALREQYYNEFVIPQVTATAYKTCNGHEKRKGPKAESAQFKNTNTTHETRHTAAAAPQLKGEHVLMDHHILETFQPIGHKDTVTPETVHTTIPSTVACPGKDDAEKDTFQKSPEHIVSIFRTLADVAALGLSNHHAEQVKDAAVLQGEREMFKLGEEKLRALQQEQQERVARIERLEQKAHHSAVAGQNLREIMDKAQSARLHGQ